MPKFNDLTGRKFGRLTVIKYAGRSSSHKSLWLCECDCEKHKKVKVIAHNLLCGRTQSCGCLSREKWITYITKHGLSRSRIGLIYRHMKDRCFNPNNQFYDDYGGRGITVCEEWLGTDGFQNFIEWAYTNGYSDSLTIDRIDVNGNYEPNNCRWATLSMQNNNKRNNHYITINNKTKTVKEWCEIYQICTGTFYYRMRKLKMNEIEALTTPLRDNRFAKQNR